MTDVGTQLRASVEATRLVQDVLDAATDILRHGNDLFHTPADVEVFLRTLAAATRACRDLAELDRIVRHPDEA